MIVVEGKLHIAAKIIQHLGAWGKRVGEEYHGCCKIATW